MMLMNRTPGMRNLLLPWSAYRKSFAVNLNENNCLSISPSIDSQGHGIYATSIPKSGTHLLNLILHNLGYKFCGLHAFDDSCNDYRLLPLGTQDHINYYPNVKELVLPIPFYVLVDLIPPDTILPSHLLNLESIRKARLHNMNKILYTTRDLRHIHVSLMRHVMWIKGHGNPKTPVKNYTPIQMIEYCHSIDPFTGLMNLDYINKAARVAVSLKSEDYALGVCFEDITSNNRKNMESSINSICTVTGKNSDDVFQAIQQSCGTDTLTYTGQPSTLDRIWTQEVEDIFVASGGDVLNEQLGYQRRHF